MEYKGVHKPRSMEYKGEGNDPPYHYALQTILHLNKEYVSGVQIPRTCIHKCYVVCLKLEYFLKSCKT